MVTSYRFTAKQRMQHREQRMRYQVRDVLLRAGEVVVDAQKVVSAMDQAVAQVRPDEAGAPAPPGGLALHSRECQLGLNAMLR